MEHSELLTISVIVFILAISSQQTEVVALKCWECDSTYHSECAHGENILSPNYRSCNGDYGKIPVCVKIGSPRSGIRRQCANDFIKANDICTSARQIGMDCKICDYDGCNAASSYGHGPTIVFITVPMALLRILSA